VQLNRDVLDAILVVRVLRLVKIVGNVKQYVDHYTYLRFEEKSTFI